MYINQMLSTDHCAGHAVQRVGRTAYSSRLPKASQPEAEYSRTHCKRGITAPSSSLSTATPKAKRPSDEDLYRSVLPGGAWLCITRARVTRLGTWLPLPRRLVHSHSHRQGVSAPSRRPPATTQQRIRRRRLFSASALAPPSTSGHPRRLAFRFPPFTLQQPRLRPRPPPCPQHKPRPRPLPPPQRPFSALVVRAAAPESG